TVQDREICLAAGMDDYLSKPFRPRDLRRLLERYASSERAAAGAGLGSMRSAEASGTLGFGGGALERLRLEVLGTDDLDELGAFVDDCIRDLDELLRAAEAAAHEGDAVALERAVHTVRSNGALVGASALVELAERLEQELREGEATAEGASARLPELRVAWQAYRRELQQERASWRSGS